MELLRNLLSTSGQNCEHAPDEPATPRCDACEKCGSTWNLRMCATCGHVGCCDSQAGDARHHYERTGHAVMVSMPAGHGFSWCYRDDRYVG